VGFGAFNIVHRGMAGSLERVMRAALVADFKLSQHLPRGTEE